MRTTLMIFASCFALAGASVARAEEPDVAALQQQVRQLRQTVLELQKRVDRLEGRRAPAAQAAPVAAPRAAQTAAPRVAQTPAPRAAQTPAPGAGYVTPEAALKATWHRIRPDMAQSEVVALLGEPSKKFVLDGRRGWYYYYPGTGGGSVFFTEEGRVSSRQSPFGLGW